MIALVSGATGYLRGGTVGTLIVPRSWNRAVETLPGLWAMDNGAFCGFDAGAFMRMLEAFADRSGCLFVAAPDYVGDAAATLEAWRFWSKVIRGLGLPPAFVAQDGLTPDRVPWRECEAVFIGGTTAWKESAAARSLCAYAKAQGKWIHWGRVNGKRRYELAVKAGADSLDGTSRSIAPNVNIPLDARWMSEIQMQPELIA